MSTKCSIGDDGEYHLYSECNDFVDGSPLDNIDTWVWLRRGNEQFRVIPRSVFERMVKEDCNGVFKHLLELEGK